ncbi:MAG: hypothetical protein D6738_02475 [Acidobacteria bacterium]|nr:MAG: hypothetical protein D6738_02475 [Acidobacteriota bacterium]
MRRRHARGETRPGERGVVLLDALVAGALLGLLAFATLALVDHALRIGREADRLDAARAAAHQVLEELEAASWHALPETFRAADADRVAVLDTADGSAPARWSALAARLPSGRIVARLAGLGPGGAPQAFGAAIALRVAATVSWAEDGRTRSVRLVTVRT